ncbi:hypothetical protein V6N11_017020 [Hibiscus sabdariffa]|uniref:Uncharacterized protein n=1 Tax=Hibiscus sabdariffa TaxID=183260 RepID=A0ABR2TXB8_9ROSI
MMSAKGTLTASLPSFIGDVLTDQSRWPKNRWSAWQRQLSVVAVACCCSRVGVEQADHGLYAASAHAVATSHCKQSVATFSSTENFRFNMVYSPNIESLCPS